MSYKTLGYQLDDNGIVTITINRPDKLNALNKDVLDDLSDAFKKASTSKKVKGVILTGAGEKAFVAGADIKELQSLDEQAGQEASRKGQKFFQSIEDLRKPVIAVVNGYALGGGAELAMACHLRIASTEAVFGLPEVGLGLIPGYGGTQRLPQIVGRANALEMILTGKQVKADEALQMGLVNIVEKNPMLAASEMLEKILSNGPLAIQNAIDAVLNAGGTDGYQLEADIFGKLCATDDANEGISAFLEKRKPEFKGR